MPVYRVNFTTKGYLEITAPDEEAAYENAVDIIGSMNPSMFHDIFCENVEANEVEGIEDDMNPHDYYFDREDGS